MKFYIFPFRATKTNRNSEKLKVGHRTSLGSKSSSSSLNNSGSSDGFKVGSIFSPVRY